MPARKVRKMSKYIAQNDSPRPVWVHELKQLKSRTDAKKLFKKLTRQQKDELLLGLLFALAEGALQRVGNG